MVTSPSPVTSQLWVGVDIAAATFTAAWTHGEGAVSKPRTYPQDSHGFARLQTDLQATGIALAETVIVMEATGSYWIALAVTLHDAGYRVSVINPLGAHHFAKAQLRRAKTDARDAQDPAARSVSRGAATPARARWSGDDATTGTQLIACPDPVASRCGGREGTIDRGDRRFRCTHRPP